MVRVKSVVYTRQRKKKLFRLSKGYRGRKKNVYRMVKEQVSKSLRHAYRARKNRKREFRSLWIARINAAARLQGLTYSQLVSGLSKANVKINRKMLAELAVNNPLAFSALVGKVKTYLPVNKETRSV